MAEYQRRVYTPPTRVEYVLPNPTNWAEYDKAIHNVDAEVKRLGITPADDTVTIAATDEEIVISFALPEDGA